jgi:adenosylmethionine-8-amino-7-oxononanoate aminotransferase
LYAERAQRHTEQMTSTTANAKQDPTRFWHPFADMSVVKDSEFVVDHAEDVWLWDSDGKRYLDGTASLWYCNVGHGRPEIAAAIAAQLAKLETYSAFGDFTNEPARELAGRLATLAPVDDARVFFGSGGGDGIEAAAKLARRYWNALGKPQRTVVLSRASAYHGTHGFGTALAGIEPNREGFGQLLSDSERVARDDSGDLERTIERLGPERVAAFFIEPVIGAGGVHLPAPGYIERVAEICARTGVLLIVDSVICGFGRLGTWFGIERWGVRPDMIVFAKGVTSGYLPLGGVITSGRIAEPFWSGSDHTIFRQGATYAGHATCCAAGLANIDLLEREGLIARGRELESDLRSALEPLAGHEMISELRAGLGLVAALEIDAEVLGRRPTAPQDVFKTARRQGVIVRPLGAGIALSPPLTATPEHFHLAAEAIGTGLDELARTLEAAPAAA